MDKNQDKKGMSRRTFVKTAVAGAAGLTLSSWGVPTLLKAASEPLKIGCIFPLTGPMAGYGLPTKAAMEYCCEKMNAKDGIMGRKLVPVFRDEQLSPEVTVRALKDLVLNEGCVHVCGAVASSDALAASLAARDMGGKVLWASLCGSTPRMTEEEGHRHQIRVTNNTTAWGRCISIASAKKYGKDVKTIYCLNPDFAYGHGLKDEFVLQWKIHAPHVKVIGETWPPLGSTDYTSYITAVLSAKPDIVQSSVYGGDAIIFMKQAAAYGLLQKVKFVDPDLGLMGFLNDLRKGDLSAPIGAVVQTMYPCYQFNDPENVEFYTTVRKKSGFYPHSMSISPPYYLGYLKFAMEKAGTTTDLEKIIDVFDQGITINGPVGETTIRGCDHQWLNPIWVGTLAWDPTGKWPMPIVVDTVKNLYPEMIHSCEEVKAIRTKAGNSYWYKQ